MIKSVPWMAGKIMSKGFAPPSPKRIVRPRVFEANSFTQRLQECFAEIKDPGVERTRLHQLSWLTDKTHELNL